MRIVYYTDQLYLHGGVERVLSQKLNYLVESINYEIFLITSEQKNKNFCYPISKKVKHYDLAINYDRSKSYFNPINLIKVPNHIKKLKGKLKKIKPDVLIVCNYSFDFYFIPFISKGIKTIKEYHSSRYFYIKDLTNTSFFNNLKYKFNSFIERKYSFIVVLNNDEKKYYKSNNVVVIPNPIKQVKKKDNIQRKNIIIAAGRIAPVKQFDHLIKAWSQIADKYTNWEVHIYGVGDTSLSNNLQLLIDELEVDNIHLKGATNCLNSKMKESSIYALTSATECMPMVLLESLSCGLPIVAYDCPTGARNIITNNEDGFLVTYNDIHSFSDKLEELIKNKELRNTMGINGVNNVIRFEEKNIMQQWIELFNRTP